MNSLFKNELIDCIKSNGFAIIKGKSLSAEQFDEITKQISDRTLIHGADRTGINEDDSIQEVTKGTDYVPPHMEMGRMPVQPDIAAFFCESPAEKGGETVILDGKVIYQNLSMHARNYFSNNLIKFTAVMDLSYWRRSWGCNSIDDVKELINLKFNSPSLTFDFQDNENVAASFTTSAFKYDKKGNAYFTNSIFGPYKGSGGGVLSDEYGEDIPENILSELAALYERHSEVISLAAGDMVLLDNRRYMHGRLAFVGQNRQMYAKFFDIDEVGNHYEN